MKELVILINKLGTYHELFKFQLKEEQTVYYSRIYPSLGLPSVHTTWHNKTKDHINQIIHVRKAKEKPYLRENLNISSNTVFRYPFCMVDLTKINWINVKKAKLKGTEMVITIPYPFPNYITTYFFQGDKDLLPSVIEKFINSKEALVFFPFYDGVYSGPKGHPMKCTNFIYEFGLNTSIGGVILGAEPPIKGYNPKGAKLINKGSLVAFAPGKEIVIKY